MKMNYNPNNNERIEGPKVDKVLRAAYERYGYENYIARNVQTRDNAHWIAERLVIKGNAGII
ncbi:hypothetical protein [Bacillus tropicus]|uniref:hypothetical protein n=1 Tax=Bacillus tropicus TaxID=2026188 RepID=UPI0024070A81|nr:hypothetical protein [Bacillus tropicus]MDF9556300.1 hypothetical protein [Bacillus tropicus]MDF9646217.1 hypothetical protein [Bacillus tropicus]